MEGRIDGGTQNLDDFRDLSGLDGKRRGEQNMIAPLAVDGSTARIAQQSAGQRLGLDPPMDLQLGVEGFAAGPIGNQLEAEKQTTAPNIADMRVAPEACLQARAKRLSLSHDWASRSSRSITRWTARPAAQAVG